MASSNFKTCSGSRQDFRHSAKTETLDEFRYQKPVFETGSSRNQFPWFVMALSFVLTIGSTSLVPAQESVNNTQPGQPAVEDVTTMFTLKYAPALSMAEMLDQLFAATDGLKIVPDTRTNKVIVKGPPPAIDKVTELIEAIDIPDAQQPDGVQGPLQQGVSAFGGMQPSARGNKASGMFGGIGGRGGGFGGRPPAPKRNLAEVYREAQRELQDLRQQFQSQEAKAIEQADVAREVKGDENAAADAQTSLRDAVEHAYELRQQLQRAEIEALQLRVKMAEDRIQRRQQDREQIIEGRVREFLAGKVKSNQATRLPSGPRIQLNYEQTPLHEALQEVAGILDRALDYEGKLDGTITYQSRRAIPADQVLDIFKQKLAEIGRDLEIDKDAIRVISKSTYRSGNQATPSNRYAQNPLATANVELLKNEVERMEKLVEKGYVTKQELETARARLHQSEREQEKQIRLQEIELRKAMLTVEELESKHKMVRKLQSTNPQAITQQEVRTIEFELEKAQLEVQRAQTMLQFLQGD